MSGPGHHPLLVACLRAPPPALGAAACQAATFETLTSVDALLRRQLPAGAAATPPALALPLVEALILDAAELQQLLDVGAPPRRVALVAARLGRTLDALQATAPADLRRHQPTPRPMPRPARPRPVAELLLGWLTALAIILLALVCLAAVLAAVPVPY